MGIVGITQIVICAVAVGASFVQSSCGIGYAIITMAAWPAYIPFKTASITEHIASLVLSGFILLRLCRSVKWRQVLPCAFSGTITMQFGIHLLLNLRDLVLHRIMGVTLLVLLAYFLTLSAKVHIKASLPMNLFVGAITGFFAGLFNIGGPLMAAYFLSVSKTEKNVYHATLQAYFVTIGIAAIITHILAGNFSAEIAEYSAFAIVGTLCGGALGMYCFHRLNMGQIRKILYIFMGIAGTALLVWG